MYEVEEYFTEAGECPFEEWLEGLRDIQAKKKLSQNKTKQEQEKIITSLSESVFDNEKLIADYMSKEL